MPLDTSKFTVVKTAKYAVLHPLKGCKPMKAAPVVSTKKAAPVKQQKENEDDEDDDLFGDEDEETEKAAQEAAEKRAQAAKATKEKKAPVERSQVVLEVKPWDAETDLEELALKIKATAIEGLKWGEGHKLVPVAFGIKKLLVQCVIIDDLVSLDDIIDGIAQYEDYVQSVDVASMNKL